VSETNRTILSLKPRHLLFLATTFLGAPSFLTSQSTGGVPPENPRIITRATETVEVTPDRAMITVSVETKDRTAALAGAMNARIQTAVIDTLKKLGIAPAQLRTSGVQISPEYQYPPNGKPILTGYRAANSIRVEIRQLTLVGGVIDGALAKGATRVDGLSFFASDTELATREAYKKAVTRARLDAEAIAQAAGGRIAGVLEIVVNPGYQAPEPQMIAMAMARTMEAETPVEAGTTKISVSVEVRFRFQETGIR
jgi:uncharacterized protein YggE